MTRLFIPGPTEIHPDVASALTRPMMSHRGHDFRELFARLQAGLRPFFATNRTVAIVTSSSTALMEMGVRAAPPGTILSLVNGGFSARFAEVARACGRDVVQVDVPWGAAHNPSDVARAMKSARFSALTVVQCETSTGVLNDVRDITRVAHEHGAVALVDAVSSMGGAPCATDDWELDYVFVGSQKTLALPPGLAMAAASDAFIESARQSPARGFYLDLASYIDDAGDNETPSTPGLSLMYALDAQLARVAAEGMPSRLARHAAMARLVHDWAERSAHPGVNVLAPEGHRSPTVTVLTLPERIPTAHVLHAMKTRGFTIGVGYGPLSSGSVRIGHMGEHTLESVGECVAALDDSILSLKV